MERDDDSLFYETQPNISGLTLSQMNNKSSVLCPESQDITSQYLTLQQLDAHQRMLSRARGVVDTSAPKSMQSYKYVSSQQKKKMMNYSKNKGHAPYQDHLSEVHNRPSSSRLTVYSEEEENGSTVSFLNKAIQTGIPVSDFTCKTAEKISWYLEALSLGELQSDYFSFLNHKCNLNMKLQAQQCVSAQCKKRTIRGDIMEWHKEHFVEPKKPFSPRLLVKPNAKSKVREMRCYNPPFRKKKTHSSHSSDTFESYEEDDNEESSQLNENHKSSEESCEEEETLVNRRTADDSASHYSYHSSVPFMPHYRRDYHHHHTSSSVHESEEDKYLDFLSKVTEDILRSGVFSDKAIQQAFEFHLQFYKDDPHQDKLQSLLQQVLDGLKVSNDDGEDNFQPRKSFLFSLRRPNSPPEKESGVLLNNDCSGTAADQLNSTSEDSVDNNELYKS